MYKFLPYMTNDLSTGLYDSEVEDIYHSAYGALTEAYEKFINPILKTSIVNKTELNVLDICYGIGYNTKALLQNFLSRGVKLYIDCVDIDKTLIELSPFISSKINLYNRLVNKKYILKNIKHYKVADKIVKKHLKTKNKYKISNSINKILLHNMIKMYGNDFLSIDAKNLLSKEENHAFFNKDDISLYKFLANYEVQLIQNENKSTFVHNIYYKNILKRYNNFYDNFINVRFFAEDIRKFVKSTNSKYDVIFLDGFTPSKCPCIWSVDFINALTNTMSEDAVIVTYNTSAPVRNAMRLAGLYIGNTYSNNKIVGTIASKNNSQIIHKLAKDEIGLIYTKAGIPYRDVFLNNSNEKILYDREQEFLNSNLETSSRYLKRCKNGI